MEGGLAAIVLQLHTALKDPSVVTKDSSMTAHGLVLASNRRHTNPEGWWLGAAASTSPRRTGVLLRLRRRGSSDISIVAITPSSIQKIVSNYRRSQRTGTHRRGSTDISIVATTPSSTRKIVSKLQVEAQLDSPQDSAGIRSEYASFQKKDAWRPEVRPSSVVERYKRRIYFR